MRKVLLIPIILTILLIPTIVLADVNYNDSVDYANRYIDAFLEPDNYILLKGDEKYIYEDGTFLPRDSFIRGGFLSKSEYDIVNYNNNAYLSPGIQYWLAQTLDGKKYVVDYKIKEVSDSSISGVRVTEYAKPQTSVSGDGSFTNPWVFLKQHTVKVVSESLTMGEVNPNDLIYVADGKSTIVKAIPNFGYLYKGNTCAVEKSDITTQASANFEVDMIFNKVTSNITCLTSFEPRRFNIQLVSNKVLTKSPDPNIITLLYNNGWYSGKAKINKITIPETDGYTFNGYEYMPIDNNGNVVSITNPVISKTGVINANNKIIQSDFDLTQSSSLQFVATWTPNPLVFDNHVIQTDYNVNNHFVSFAGASNGTGQYSYTTSNSTFSIPDATKNEIYIPAGTNAGTYQVNINAVDRDSGATGSAIINIEIKKIAPILTYSIEVQINEDTGKKGITIFKNGTFTVSTNIDGYYDIENDSALIYDFAYSAAYDNNSRANMYAINSITIDNIKESSNTHYLIVKFEPTSSNKTNYLSVEDRIYVTAVPGEIKKHLGKVYILNDGVRRPKPTQILSSSNYRGMDVNLNILIRRGTETENILINAINHNIDETIIAENEEVLKVLSRSSLSELTDLNTSLYCFDWYILKYRFDDGWHLDGQRCYYEGNAQAANNDPQCACNKID